jgi:hypothetical protein
MRTRILALPAGLALLLFVAPASALESLTGTWEGVLKCATLDSGTRSKTKVATVLEIVDSGPGGLQIELVSSDLLFVGFVVADGAKPDKGALSAASCAFAFDELDGGTLQADVKTRAGAAKATLKARLSLMGAVQEIVRSCTITAKRVSADEPDIIGCAF